MYSYMWVFIIFYLDFSDFYINLSWIFSMAWSPTNSLIPFPLPPDRRVPHKLPTPHNSHVKKTTLLEKHLTTLKYYSTVSSSATVQVLHQYQKVEAREKMYFGQWPSSDYADVYFMLKMKPTDCSQRFARCQV
jgi:hypothetical protein